MKKFVVILLATVFIFGLAAQASADVDLVGVDAFAGDEVITFDGFNLGDEIFETYKTTHGVEFSKGWYAENTFLGMLFGLPNSATNVDLSTYSLTETVVTIKFDTRVTRVGFDINSPLATEKTTVTVYRDDEEQGFIEANTSATIFIGIQDTNGIDAISIDGKGRIAGYAEVVFIDNLRFGGTPDTGPEYREVDVHIKPPNCIGAPINVKSQGVTPVVIAGSEDFDVTLIDPDSIKLEGATPVRSDIEYASLCNEVEGDGELDLALKFNTQDLIDGIKSSLVEGEALQDGHNMVPLQLTGYLYDNTPIREKEDSVWVTVLVKGKQDKENKGKGKNK